MPESTSNPVPCPGVTGLYTLLLPMAVFAILGSSRHLVVGADSATAAILGASLAGLAVTGSPQYVRLAGLAALLAGGLLLLARLARLGFLANFLSRTVLVGFLTGVGIQVAAGQLPDMLGITAEGKSTLTRLLEVVRALPQVHGADVALSAGVIVIVLAARWADRRVPGLLIAVIVAIIVSRAADLGGHGVALLGPVPRGLPHLGQRRPRPRRLLRHLRRGTRGLPRREKGQRRVKHARKTAGAPGTIPTAALPATSSGTSRHGDHRARRHCRARSPTETRRWPVVDDPCRPRKPG
jgi:MFS superfamily sulfate permease-like transporter